MLDAVAPAQTMGRYGVTIGHEYHATRTRPGGSKVEISVKYWPQGQTRQDRAPLGHIRTNYEPIQEDAPTSYADYTFSRDAERQWYIENRTPFPGTLPPGQEDISEAESIDVIRARILAEQEAQRDALEMARATGLTRVSLTEAIEIVDLLVGDTTCVHADLPESPEATA
jgi:hypothetical protein